MPKSLGLTIFDIKFFFKNIPFKGFFFKVSNMTRSQFFGHISKTANRSNLGMVPIDLKLNFTSDYVVFVRNTLYF